MSGGWASQIPWGQAGAGISAKVLNQINTERQIDFQRDMANSAHQREVRDLRKAGLNPLLSARHGGAATPPGAAANHSTPDVAGTMTKTALSASQVALNKAQINDINSAAALKIAQTNDVYATQAERIDLMIAQKLKTLQDRDVGKQDELRLKEEIKNLKVLKDQIIANTAATVADTHKKKLYALPFEAGNFIADKFKKLTPKNKEEFKKDFHEAGNPKHWRDYWSR